MEQSLDLSAARKHFKAHDPIMYHLVKQVTEHKNPIVLPKPLPPRAYFGAIVSSIVGQQISTKAAAAVRARLVARVGKLTPRAISAISEEDLQSCGLSAQKTRYLKTNADLWHTIPVRSFAHMNDEEIIAELTKLYGVGTWTAEMFLMFSMARPDVFSYGDLGLMGALYQNYPLKTHWNRKLEQTVNAWSPHRTIASLTLWHVRDNEPVILSTYVQAGTDGDARMS